MWQNQRNTTSSSSPAPEPFGRSSGSYSLLNNLHSIMGQTPVVVFYPGKFDGQSMRLFGRIKGGNYYRAFRLVP